MTVVKITNLTEARRAIRKHASCSLKLWDILFKGMRGFGSRVQNWFCRMSTMTHYIKLRVFSPTYSLISGLAKLYN
jgi:hypothetical protein